MNKFKYIKEFNEERCDISNEKITSRDKKEDLEAEAAIWFITP